MVTVESRGSSSAQIPASVLSVCQLFLVIVREDPQITIITFGSFFFFFFPNAVLPVQMDATPSTPSEYCKEEGAGHPGSTPPMVLILSGTHCTSQVWLSDSSP